MSKKDRREEGVGYAKPPKSSQFKPGRSGNPGGRKKGAQNLATYYQALLERQTTLQENGKKRTVLLIEALLLRLADTALKGDIKAINSLLDRLERHQSHLQDQDLELPEEDRALLQSALKQRTSSCRTPKGASPREKKDV